MISRSINVLFTLAVVILLAVSCSSETEPQIPDPDEGREKSVVDISLSLGEGWDIDDDGTRAAPPSVGTDENLNNYNKEESYKDIQDVNTVRVIAFRRKEGDTGEFYYDKLNDMILPVNQYPQGDHKHKIAEGKLTKTYGYEYRVIAIAYSSTKKSSFPAASGAPQIGEEKWFELTGETYSNYNLKLNTVDFDAKTWEDYLTGATTDPNGGQINNNQTKHINQQIIQTPQIFYGILYSQNSKSEVIPYAEEDSDGKMDSEVGLEGILKRGVARVDITITPTIEKFGLQHLEYQWISILAETPNTKVGLTSYYDFLSPSEPILKESEHKYTAIAYIPKSKMTNDKPTTITLWMLPCKTRLGIRVRSQGINGSIAKHLRNGQFVNDSISYEGHGENGTGIVSPDFVDGVFYFRRNHKYSITISDSENVIKNHNLD